MLTASLLSLVLSAQVSNGRPNTLPLPEENASPSKQEQPVPTIKIGTKVRIARSYASTTYTGLNLLAYLTYYDTGTPESRKEAIQAMAKEGMIIAIDKPTRAIIQHVASDRDPISRREVFMYQGRLLEGPLADRMIFVFDSQLADAPEDWEQPTPFDDAKREVYKLARKAIGDAKAKAGRADLSVRKAVLDREVDENIRRLAK